LPGSEPVLLVDTSAWIDYLRDARTPITQQLQELIDAGMELVTTERP
jgi:hypothetical protein